MDNVTDRDLLWKQYELQVDLFRFYFDTAIKVNLFYYAVTGGVVSYFLANSEQPLLRYALILPVVMGLVLTILFWIGARLLKVVESNIFSIAETLRLSTTPSVGILVLSLRIFGALFGGSAIALLILMFAA